MLENRKTRSFSLWILRRYGEEVKEEFNSEFSKTLDGNPRQILKDALFKFYLKKKHCVSRENE
jgi:hypothetical protein